MRRGCDRAHPDEPGRRGPPRTGYHAIEERLDYRVLAEVLAIELGGTGGRTRPACPARRTAIGEPGSTVGPPGEAVVSLDNTDTAQVGDPLEYEEPDRH